MIVQDPILGEPLEVIVDDNGDDIFVPNEEPKE